MIHIFKNKPGVISLLILSMGVSSFHSSTLLNQEYTKKKKLKYPVVETGQTAFYNNFKRIKSPGKGEPFYGQDAHYNCIPASYTDNGDGTITDNVTGLMWEKGFRKSDYTDANANAKASTTGGYTDWRVPTIKELYSLIDFSGNQGTGLPNMIIPPRDAVPFINTGFFRFEYPKAGRFIDAQYISSTEYTGNVMKGSKAFFGVNLADGRIKGYPQNPGRNSSNYGRWYLRLVRGSSEYGKNNFKDNKNGTVTDKATGLMWLKDDSGSHIFAKAMKEASQKNGSLNWEEALYFAENLTYAGYSDWRLPNAKELHTIVDYTRSPDITKSAAINPVFNTAEIINETGVLDYPAYWSSTTFNPGRDAVIFHFGRALGYFHGRFLDVHGAGAQRTDPKAGKSSYGKGPQGDVRRVYNYARLVRNVKNE